MATDAANEIESLREELGADNRSRDGRDRERLLNASDNTRLVPLQIGDHRHIEMLRQGVHRVRKGR
jgi:hypothetical protein